ncbi:MAG: choice-of-anchor D domain-containing protein, partial [Calditrichaeota bacterium]
MWRILEMRKQLYIFIISVVLVIQINLLAQTDQQSNSRDIPQNPQLQPDIDAVPDTLDFGEVVVLDDSLQQLLILNIGTQNLIIDDLGIVGNNDTLFSVVNPPQLPVTILPGDTLALTVRFAPLSPGNKSAFLVITNNDPDSNPLFVILKGRAVLPDIFVTPTALNFGDVVVGTSASLSIQISNTGVGNLIVSDLDILGANAGEFEVTSSPPLPIVIAPGAPPEQIEITLSPDSMGIKSAFLSIVSNDPDENPVFISLSGVGTEARITSSIAQINFGDVWVGEDSLTSFQIWNEGNIDLVITSLGLVGTNSDQFSLPQLPNLPITLAPFADTLELFVSFNPTTLGIKNAQIEFQSNDPNDNPYFVDLSGRGVLPDIAANPPTVTFDSVLVGDSAFVILQIQNTGTAPLTISDTSLIGSHRGLFEVKTLPQLPVIIPPDGNFIQVELKFTPDSVGLKTATLQFFSDDPDENPLLVDLFGDAVQADIATQPNPVQFGKVRVGSDSVLTVQILNTGSATLSVFDTLL